MFIAIYRGIVSQECEKLYRESWKTVASYFVEEMGAINASLNRDCNGHWIAISKWPSKEMRDRSWPCGDHPAEIQEAISTLQQCVSERLPEIELNLVEEV